ncbi:MAG: hypothetical protein AAFY72_16310, partial [Cyanobacteria bacterium J06649_4]
MLLSSLLAISKRSVRRQFRLFLGVLGLIAFLTFSACSTTSSVVDTNQIPPVVNIGYQVIPNASVLAKSLKLVERKFP